jgi:cysteine desulfurase
MLNRVFFDVAAGYGNPNAIYAEGRRAKWFIEMTKDSVAKILNTTPECLFVVPSASLANHFLFNCFTDVAVSEIEHASVTGHPRARKILDVGCTGRVIARKVEADLISVALANHEVGTIQDLTEIKKANPDTLVHSDATAAFGKIPIDLGKLPVDYMTISGSKLGVQGIAFLYCRDPDSAPELPVGTTNVEAARRLGEVLKGLRMPDRALRDNLRDLIVREIPDVSINTPKELSLPNLLNVSFGGAEGESIMLMLDEAGVAVSTGSACLLGEPSPVILAIGGDAELAHNSIRFSWDADATQEDVAAVMSVLPNIIKKLREVSTR